MTATADEDRLTLAHRLEGLRKAREMSYEAVARAVYTRLGWAPTAQTMRMLHLGGKDPDTVDVILLATLADVYGVRIGEISPRVAARIEAMEAMLRNRCRSPHILTDLAFRVSA